jgi:hypothetical protein
LGRQASALIGKLPPSYEVQQLAAGAREGLCALVLGGGVGILCEKSEVTSLPGSMCPVYAEAVYLIL